MWRTSQLVGSLICLTYIQTLETRGPFWMRYHRVEQFQEGDTAVLHHYFYFLGWEIQMLWFQVLQRI